MKATQRRRYETLVKVGDFGREQSGLFPSTTPGGQMFAAVAASVAEINVHATTQGSGGGVAREGVTSKAAARRALRAQLEKIARTARALAVDTPELSETFWLPQGQTDQAQLSTARAFAAGATPLATVFISHEMPDTFLADLTTAIGRFEEAIHDREAAKAAHAAAQAGIATAMRSGMAAVRKLDAIVPNKLDHDPVAMAAWEKTRHVEPAPRSKRVAATPAAGSASATSATNSGSAEHP